MRLDLGANFLDTAPSVSCILLIKTEIQCPISICGTALPANSSNTLTNVFENSVARLNGHTPQELPAKDVSKAATSCFIAYQALLLYTIFHKIARLSFFSVRRTFTESGTMFLCTLYKYIFREHFAGIFKRDLCKNLPSATIL